jgi:L-ascorbate metabolism protein UlaG (beta-lactamase superfamily)
MNLDKMTDEQALISRRRNEIVHLYPSLWERIIEEWKSPGSNDRAWLVYSASYLFFTGNTRWALDPLTLHWRVPEARPVDAVGDLEGLSFILLTHRHADHLDLGLVSDLGELPILWIIPEPLLKTVAEAGLSPKKVIVPEPMMTLEVEGVKITSFEGLHWEVALGQSDSRRGVPATGYLVEFSGKRWLFPGDVRTYDASKLPRFGPVDGLFAHLWLGRGCALNAEPPLLAAFCSFCLNLQPKRIVVTHLEEFGHKESEYWHEGHFKEVKNWIFEHVPDCEVESAYLGERVEL